MQILGGHSYISDPHELQLAEGVIDLPGGRVDPVSDAHTRRSLVIRCALVELVDQLLPAWLTCPSCRADRQVF
ncbi:hypothetical protein D3C78_1592610 [compost metagenome]